MRDPAEAPPLTLADLLAMLRRRRVAALAAAVLVAIIVMALPGILMPRLYRAEATLSLDRGLKPVSFQSDPVAGLVPEQMVNTQRELLTSKAVLDNALSMGGLLSNPLYGASSDPASLLERRLRTSSVKNSWVILVSLDDEDPVRAENGLQAVLDAFLANQATVARTRGAQDLAFLDAQLAEAKARLEAARESERRYREEHAIASVDPDRNHITARIQTLAEKQGGLDERLAASTALLRQVEAADAIEDAHGRMSAYLRIDTISTFTVVGALQQELYKLLGFEAEMAAKYLDKHPKLVEVRSHIAAKREQLEETVVAARSAIAADNLMLVEQRAALVRAQDDLQRDLNLYRHRLTELQRLILESQAQQKVHDELQARRAQLGALAGYDDRRMVVESRPRASPVARGVGTLPLAALAALTALAAAVAGAALADGFDRTIRDERQLRDATGLRLLGRVPLVRQLQPVCASGPGEPAELAEAMRTLWVSLRYALGQSDGCRTITVASPVAQDGRTTLAARLAVSAAMSGSRVLLVDGDLRQPSQAAQFGIAQGPGLAALLAGVPEIAPAPTGIPNLDLMPAGESPANPSELLNSHCLPEWIAHVREHYDLVLFDAPALIGCSDALLLAGQTDGVVLAARTASTPRDALAEAWNRLEPVRGKVLGSVLAARAQATRQ
jgi:succinoglycan biosynthesis transport protein ExoP